MGRTGSISPNIGSGIVKKSAVRVGDDVLAEIDLRSNSESEYVYRERRSCRYGSRRSSKWRYK